VQKSPRSGTFRTCKNRCRPVRMLKRNRGPVRMCNSPREPVLMCKNRCGPVRIRRNYCRPVLMYENHCGLVLTCRNYCKPVLMCKTHCGPVRTCRNYSRPVLKCKNHCGPVRVCRNYCRSERVCRNLCGFARFFENNFEPERILKNGLVQLYCSKKRCRPLSSRLPLCVINVASQNKMHYCANKSVTYVHTHFLFRGWKYCSMKIIALSFLSRRWTTVRGIRGYTVSLDILNTFRQRWICYSLK